MQESKHEAAGWAQRVDDLLAQRALLLEALERIANAEYRSDRRHRGMVDVEEVERLCRTARAAIKAAKEGGGE